MKRNTDKITIAFLLLLLWVVNGTAQQAEIKIGTAVDDIAILSARMKQQWLAQLPQVLPAMPVNGKWADIDYTIRAASTWPSSQHWDRLAGMAKIWVGKSPKATSLLKNAMEEAIHFWCEKKPTSSNYWWNAMGVPLKMGEVLVLMQGQLPQPLVDSVIALMRLGIKPNYYDYYGPATGQNQIWLAQVHASIGIVQKDTLALRRAFNAFHNEVYLSTGEGIQYDNSFFQHGRQLYSGGYGIGFTEDIAALIRLADGTAFRFPDEKISIFANFLLQGQQWMIYKNVFDYSTMGREISRIKNADGRAKAMANVCDNLGSLGTSYKSALQQMQAQIKDTTINTFTGNRHFWRGDMMIHRTQGFYTSIKMTSDRIKSSEWGNKENEKSFYLGQGVQLLMQRGDEYRQIFPIWDWRKLPGTLSAQTDTMPKTNGPWGEGAQGKKPFTGGVSDGTVGLAANDYELLNIRAHRAWFCFESQVLVMGAAINYQGGHPLFQTINQCYLSGSITARQRNTPAVAIAINNTQKKIANTNWIHHDGIGYYFPKAVDITVNTSNQEGSWRQINGSIDAPSALISKPVFSAWIDFGANVKNASFAYIMVPGISSTAVANYNIPIRILENKAQLQAAWHETENTLMAAFHTADILKDKSSGIKLSVNHPSLIIYKTTATGAELTASNPLNKTCLLTVTINSKLTGEGCTWQAGTNNSTVVILLPDGNYAGKSVTVKLSK